MSKKPTPAQARALKALNAPYEQPYYRPGITIYRFRPGKISDIGNRNLNGHRINPKTATILLANEWIEKKDDDYDFFIISEKGIEIFLTLTEKDFITPAAKKPLWSTFQIKIALVKHYEKLNEVSMDGAPKWIYFDELRNGRWASSIVDFWAMSCWSGHERKSYEIKIRRNDFLKELKDPTKKEFGMLISNYFFFITPPDLIKKDEIPSDCGLIELSEKGKLITKVKAPIRSPNFKFTWDFAACLGRKTFKNNKQK